MGVDVRGAVGATGEGGPAQTASEGGGGGGRLSVSDVTRAHLGQRKPERQAFLAGEQPTISGVREGDLCQGK